MYTAIAVSKGFSGSPHIDTYDTGPQYALSLGSFGETSREGGGGLLCIEVSPTSVAEVDTYRRMQKVDGRFVHWVSGPYAGTRYSIIWFRTCKPPIPKTRAVLSGQSR